MGLEHDQPIEYLTHEIERSGVVVVVRRLLTSSSRRILGDGDSTGKIDKHLGYSVRVGEFNTRPLIVVRQSNSWERTRWTLAHEVGHLVLHASGSVTEACEEQASQFASELLAPAAVLAKEVSRAPSLAELLPVKAKWGVSLGALIKHLHTSQLLTGARFEALRRQLYTRVNPDTDTTWGRVEPGWNDREVERPRLISKWLEMAFSARSAAMLAPMTWCGRRICWRTSWPGSGPPGRGGGAGGGRQRQSDGRTRDSGAQYGQQCDSVAAAKPARLKHKGVGAGGASAAGDLCRPACHLHDRRRRSSAGGPAAEYLRFLREGARPRTRCVATPRVGAVVHAARAHRPSLG
ncbi:ImmA/IrrE family metallo-endopeptidase [Mycobacterium dioxanotrophicus]|uniref:ImmA/IrrE family metallo-endopeptidase n=1 Tax=Mycobacterium dioxanotrophicus TaxID=482462 RepID=UPI001E3AA810|nr:ImmA/IrrE family metallo-endopeptidase [Mycobacterium dioxanotrophicus]